MENEIENTSSVEVPEFLREDQNLLDQPPFNEIETSGVIPEDFFKDEDIGYPTFMRILANSATPGSEADPKRRILVVSSNSRRKLTDNVQPQYKGWSKINPVIQDVKTFLEPYPKAFSYLNDRWEEYDRKGNPTKGAWEGVKVRSYAAHLDEINKLEQSGKLVGLLEELPHLSTGHSVKEAMPKKGMANKTYRLLVGSEALK